jgi:ParB family chromosome partitioning protein
MTKAKEQEPLTLEQREIRELPLDGIKPYWNNPRENRAAVEKVKKSIEAYGYNQLIAVDPENVIVAGHTRYLALREMGVENVRVMVVDLPPEKLKAYRIIDNKSAEFASWDMDALSKEMRELADLSVMKEFFNEGDLNRMLDAAAGVNYAAVTEEDVVATEMRLGTADSFKGREKEILCPHCGGSFYIT